MNDPIYKIGLSDEEVNIRKQKNLVNFNNEPTTKSIKEILRDNIFTYFNIVNSILCALMILAGILGLRVFEALKNSTFMGVLIINTIISTVQEIVSKRIVDKLSVLASTKVKVIRNKEEKLVDINDIVLDDIMKLEIGDQIVCDSIILNGSVEVNEAFISGESDSLSKKENDTLLSGSFIVSGICYAKVINVGENNYISKISAEAKYSKKVNSVIMETFVKILKVLSVVIVPVGIILMYNQYLITGNFTDAVFHSVGALIGMIPDGLLLLTSSVMAVSIIRLGKVNTLVNELYSIETLARVDTICLDKTGTITEGKMKVNKIIPFNGFSDNDIDSVLMNYAYSFSTSNSSLEAIKEKYQVKGDYIVSKKEEFSSERKFSGVTFFEKGTYYLGAPEYLLDDIKSYEEELNKVSDYRVLALVKTNEEVSIKPCNAKLMALILIEDIIRKEAPSTLEYFKKQKVDVKIISGDSYKTVVAVAKRAGLENIKGIDATLINENNIEEYTDYDAFGRVKPHQKKMIIKALQNKGHTVAMVGDGVNDCLALKQSDCAVTFGNASDAAKSVSQIILLDSNFSNMPKVVNEGRRTINNVERSASLLLIKTIFTSILVIICLFMKSEYFYLPIHLSLITTCTISIPSFILALEPNNEKVKGNFMLNVIKKSIPPALTVVFNVVLITLFKKEFNIDPSLATTLIVIMTATTGFIFLFKLCKPFNVLRASMITILIGIFVYALLFWYDFFDLTSITFSTILLYIVFGTASIQIFTRLDNFTEYIINKVTNKVKK